jgi:hypothetical protein
MNYYFITADANLHITEGEVTWDNKSSNIEDLIKFIKSHWIEINSKYCVRLSSQNTFEHDTWITRETTIDEINKANLYLDYLLDVVNTKNFIKTQVRHNAFEDSGTIVVKDNDDPIIFSFEEMGILFSSNNFDDV